MSTLVNVFHKYILKMKVLGMLVLQDMPALIKYPHSPVPHDALQQWRTELASLVRSRRHHPSIIQWTLFNEGWGEPVENDTHMQLASAVALVRNIDASRLIDGVSGWEQKFDPQINNASNGYSTGMNLDFHDYTPLPASRSAPSGYEGEAQMRPYVLGEVGGYLNAPKPTEQWAPYKCFGHGNYTNPEHAWQKQYAQLIADLVNQSAAPQPSLKLTAAIFTQFTDVEAECNGMLFYSRESKVNQTAVAELNQLLVRN